MTVSVSQQALERAIALAVQAREHMVRLAHVACAKVAAASTATGQLVQQRLADAAEAIRLLSVARQEAFYKMTAAASALAEHTASVCAAGGKGVVSAAQSTAIAATVCARHTAHICRETGTVTVETGRALAKLPGATAQCLEPVLHPCIASLRRCLLPPGQSFETY